MLFTTRFVLRPSPRDVISLGKYNIYVTCMIRVLNREPACDDRIHDIVENSWKGVSCCRYKSSKEATVQGQFNI